MLLRGVLRLLRSFKRIRADLAPRGQIQQRLVFNRVYRAQCRYNLFFEDRRVVNNVLLSVNRSMEQLGWCGVSEWENLFVGGGGVVKGLKWVGEEWRLKHRKW